MRFNSVLAAMAAASLATAPAVAAGQRAAVTAAQTEVAPSGEHVDGNQARRGYILPLAIIVAIILGILLLSDKDEESPNSP